MKIYKRPGFYYFLVFYLTISAVWGQKNVKGSGYVLTQQRETADFTSIEISRGIDVAIVRGEMEPITVEADDNLFSYIKTTVKNKVLKIYIPDSVNIVKYASMNVLISMPTLGSLKASNHSRIDAWPQIWNLRTIRLEATTGGQIRIRLKSRRYSGRGTHLRNPGDQRRSPKLTSHFLKTAARLEARELETQNADIQLSIGAKAEIQVNQRLTYDLYGHSRLVIKGNPQIENSHNYSGSRIIKRKIVNLESCVFCLKIIVFKKSEPEKH